jgi:class 3 adenylate cyclase
LLQGKIVIAGSTMTDQHPTPVGTRFGLQMVAEATNTMLMGQDRVTNRWFAWANWLWAGLMVTATICFARTRRLWVMVAGLTVVGWLIWSVPTFTATWFGRIEFTFPLVGGLIALLGTLVIEAFEGQRLPTVSSQPSEATILFIDVRGSTSMISDKGIKVVSELMTRVFKALSKTVRQFGGEVERTTGDGLMVVFRNTATQRCADACLSAVGPIELEIERINEWFQEGHGSSVMVRMGIETGIIATVVVEGRGKEPSSVGGAINLAARLLSTAQEEGMNVLVGPETVRIAGKNWLFEPRGERQLKGFEAPVAMYLFGGSLTVRGNQAAPERESLPR